MCDIMEICVKSRTRNMVDPLTGDHARDLTLEGIASSRGSRRDYQLQVGVGALAGRTGALRVISGSIAVPRAVGVPDIVNELLSHKSLDSVSARAGEQHMMARRFVASEPVREEDDDSLEWPGPRGPS